jgi:predicted permease
MLILAEIWRRLKFLLGRRKFDRELEEEIQLHLDLKARASVVEGMTPREARRAALKEFGNPRLVGETSRDVWGWTGVECFFQDLRHGLRYFGRNPGFTAVVVVTFALGIGVNTAIFSVTNAVLLRRLPVRDPAGLAFVGSTETGTQSGWDDTVLTMPIIERLRARTDVLSDLMVFAPLDYTTLAIRYGSRVEEGRADMVSGNFFTGLGVRPVIGRTLTAEDEAGRAQVAVLSYGYWTARLNRDAGVIGRTIYIKGAPFTIIGVAAADFVGLDRRVATDVWVPLEDRADLKPWGSSLTGDQSLHSFPNWWCLMTIARLAPGISESQALSELQPIFQQAAIEGSRTPAWDERPPRMLFIPARGIEGVKDDYGQALIVLMAMVGLVLLIACSNVAMLLVARNSARQREFSLRIALGGSRARLFRQLLAESLLIVGAGSALGWLFTLWGTSALARWAELGFSLMPDNLVLGVTLGISLAAAMVFSLAPLAGVMRAPIGMVLKTTAPAAGRDRRKLQAGRVVVAMQMAVCLTLLFGAGLFGRTLRNLQNVDLGIRADGLVAFGINPQQRVHSDEEAISFYENVLDRMRSLPGVQVATLVHHRPGTGWSSNAGGIIVDGKSPTGDIAAPMRWNIVGPDYFRATGGNLVLGRDFNEADSPGGLKVAIVNQTFAERYLAGENPVGHQLAFGGGKIGRTIVGVARNSKYTGIRDSDRPTAYFPYTQISGLEGMSVEFRTAGDASAVLAEARQTLAELDPDLALLDPMTQREQFDESISNERLLARLAMFFGGLAAFLVATGLYGTLAYKMARRTPEIGVRMAIGARRGEILRMVVRDSLAVSLAGVALGIPVAVASARLLRSMLFGLDAADPLTLVGAVAFITLVAIGASLIPARRAASVDPIVALRYE